MIKIKGYNRNLVNGKRPHRKITKFGQCKNLSERLILETIALNKYLTRVNNKQSKINENKF